jgi:hypothetical protein
MFRVITQNSVYLVSAQGNGFYVTRVADMWGRNVKDSHGHYTAYLHIQVGGDFITDEMTSQSPVQAVTSGIPPKK